VTGSRTFKYVDKDRIMPYLKKRASQLQNDRKTKCSVEIESLIAKIENGYFDWQPAE